jgi:hypothetical protein
MKVIVSAVAVVLASVGCAEFTYDDSIFNEEAFAELQTGSLRLRNGSLDGEYGPRAVAGPTTMLEGYSDSYSSTVTMQRDEPNKTGMLILSADRDLATLQPGTYDTENDGMMLTVCSGDSADMIDFDVPGRGTVDVRDNDDGTRSVEVIATPDPVDEETGEPVVTEPSRPGAPTPAPARGGFDVTPAPSLTLPSLPV